MIKNAKKELGMALNEMRKSEWFTALDKETQELAIAQTKSYYAPPDKYENTFLNIYLSNTRQWQAWELLLKTIFPFSDAMLGTAEARLLKREFVSRYIVQLALIEHKNMQNKGYSNEN